MRHAFLALSLVLSTGLAVASVAGPRTLSFEDRVKAQEAIERVHYSRQIGATKPFEQAVPRAVLESKVRKYLDQTAALRMYWKTPVTDEMLHRELKRMATGTRMPERLLELYAALGNDAFLITDCLARSVLVDRLARDFYAFDRNMHAVARLRAETLHRQLASAELNPKADHPDRVVVEFVLSDPPSVNSKPESHAQFNHEIGSFRHELSRDDFRKQTSRLPDAVGQLSAIKEEHDAFVFTIVLRKTPHEVRAAYYFVSKASWDAWWATNRIASQRQALTAVAESHFALTEPPIRLSADWTPALRDERNSPDVVSDSWTPTPTLGAPPARYLHTAVWTGNEMIVWGGFFWDGSGHALFTGGRYDPATDSWSATSTIDAPTARAGHTAVWAGDLMVVWGGFDGSGNTGLDSGGRYDPRTDRWEATATTDSPSARYYQTAVWTGTEMILWGGFDSSGYDGTGGRYNPATDRWAPLSTTAAPSPRADHTAVWTGSVMVIWGGYAQFTPGVRTGGRYDPNTDSWTRTSTVNAPSGRITHTAVWTGSRMIVWGGYANPSLDTGAQYDPATDSWTPTSTTDAPSARYQHNAVWTGRLMVVWGGLGGNYLQNTGGRYDPATDRWTATCTTGAPSARWYATSLWTGNEMIVWGGNPNSALNTGGRYDPEVPFDQDGDGYSQCQGDCDDTRVLVHPGAPETCNGIDDNCDSQIDPGANALCDDNNVCTADTCQGVVGCSNLFSDHDDDGVCDASDECPATNPTPTVVIDACDSGVANHLFPDGCDFGDQIAGCRAGPTNHGQFVGCVAHLVDAWTNSGLITRQQGSRIVRCAAQ